MDVFNNVLQGTRQYFLGVPTQVQAEGSSQPAWPADAPLPEEGAPAQSGAPAPSSRPPSAAAAPPAPAATPVVAPPRPPSEPIEPEPHIIHKATVMREAAEKRREMPDLEDEEEPAGTLSPPSHIIRKPQRTLPSPAPAPAVPSPSPARPPSVASLPPVPQVAEPQLESTTQYRPPVHRVQTPTARPPEHYSSGRPPDAYSASRPPETYARYHYETALSDGGRNSHGSIASPQPSLPPRQSPQTYARMASSLPQHTASRLRDAAAHSPPAQRYTMPVAQPPPPHNDRVPPIHHPQATPPIQRHTSIDARAAPIYSPMQQRRETSPYARLPLHYDRHASVPPRKYDSQQAYPGYRPAASLPQMPQNSRVDSHHQVEAHYSRSTERSPAPIPPHSHETVRLPPRADYSNISRMADTRSGYLYPTPSTSASRYGPTVPVPAVQNSTLSSRTAYRSAAAPKSNYDYSSSNSVQTSPARSTVKPGYPNQQARMTVSVTSLVNQMNQTKQKRAPSPSSATTPNNQLNQIKQKRESPLDLSVKTVKNSADSSTTQDDMVDSASMDNKVLSLQPRPTSSTRSSHLHTSYVASHKVDFAPNFNQYGERSSGLNYAPPTTSGHPPPVRYNGNYDNRRTIAEYPVESPHHIYPERNKYTAAVGRTDYVPKIDLTRPVNDQRLPDSRIRDDRHFIIEERKRPAGAIVSNIPEKIVRYETWTADSRIERERMGQPTRDQHELMNRHLYNYYYHKQVEAYPSDPKKPAPSNLYREHPTHTNHRFINNSNSIELQRDLNDYHHSHYHDRNPSMNSRHHVIQKIPSHAHSHNLDPHSGIPADKRVLSILRNSLETKHTGNAETVKPVKPDVIVIDDADDCIIDITDTKENEAETKITPVIKPFPTHIASNFDHHIQMPKAVDSIPRDSEYQRLDSIEAKSKSPENDVAARIRTKAELKVMPPSQDNNMKPEVKPSVTTETASVKVQPKSQKQHLFNQIRKDNLYEAVIKNETTYEKHIPEVKTEPMNIEEIERDAVISIKTEIILENLEPENVNQEDPGDDLDWASACDNFMEQLQSGCHKKKVNRKQVDTTDQDSENNDDKLQKNDSKPTTTEIKSDESPLIPEIAIKKEPIDEDEVINEFENELPSLSTEQFVPETKDEETQENKIEKTKPHKKSDSDKKKDSDKNTKVKTKSKIKSEKQETPKKDPKESVVIKTVIKEEQESTDDDEPLIKSKILKDKELKYQLLKDLSEKSAYVKLECCDVDVNKNSRKSIENASKATEERPNKRKIFRQSSRIKGKSSSIDNNKQDNSSSDSDDDAVASRLRMRKVIKTEDGKSFPLKNSVKSLSPKKNDNSNTSSSSTPVRKPGFGDGSDFHPGWEEELYRYKRSLRMPTRLIAIPRGRSGGPFMKATSALFTRGSTSLPDLDPAPLSPAPSSAQSAATDDLYARRQDKLTLDSDLDSNSSYSASHRLHYDSEASTSTVFSTSKTKRNGSSIVDVLIQKCGKKDSLKKKSKDREDKSPKVISKTSNTSELLPTPSLDNMKNGIRDLFCLNFRKETLSTFRHKFLNNTDGMIGATEEFAPIVLKTRTRTESRVLKQRATIKEVFGDERPASAPPTSCREEESHEEEKEDPIIIKVEPESKPKFKPKKILKGKLQRRSSSIRDGLRSTKSLKRNDAKGRLLRLKKRNSVMKSLTNKRVKEINANKHKNENRATTEDKSTTKDEGSSLVPTEVHTKKRLKRLFGRRKFSSGFDYIRKKKKIIRRDDSSHKVRRPANKPSPESVHDIHKEIKGWFINKSVGETHLHRAARLGYTDCVAYCLEKMESDPSAKDNAGFTPLHVAAAKGHVRISRLLLQYGANVSAAAKGGIRPLHEACENCHVEVMRLLLAYGADPLLGTYTGQTPEELTEGSATKFLQLHIADVQGRAVEPWKFPPLTEIIDREELGCDALSSPPPASPPPPPDSMIEIQCTEAPLPPFYSLRTTPGQPADGLWCLLQDITNLLQIKSKESLLKQIHCGSGSPKELLREIRTQEFLERAQCHQLLCAGEKVNVRASKVALVRVTDKLRQLLKIETVLVS